MIEYAVQQVLEAWGFDLSDNLPEELIQKATDQVLEDLEESFDSLESGFISQYDHEQYLNWLAGADHSLSDADLSEIKAYLFSEEADMIHASASTILGARP